MLLEIFEVAVRELGRLEGLWEAEASPEERRRARLPKVSVGLIGGGGNPNLAVPVVLRTLREQAEDRRVRRHAGSTTACRSGGPCIHA